MHERNNEMIGPVRMRSALPRPMKSHTAWRRQFSAGDGIAALMWMGALYIGVFFYGPMLAVLALVVLAAFAVLGWALALWVRAGA